MPKQLGFEINRNLPPWRERAYGKAFPQDDRDEFIRALDAFYDRAEQAAQEAERSGRDGPANLCLEPGNRWNPMIDAISTYINGCELDSRSPFSTWTPMRTPTSTGASAAAMAR